MNTINTGGPAFPLVYDVPPENVRHVYSGMNLRDYFAAKALPISTSLFAHGHEAGWAGIAQHAYMLADAMLKARDKT